MPDQPLPPASDRFKAEMPQIPGVSGSAPGPRQPERGPWLIVAGLAAVLLAVAVGGRMLSKSGRAEAPPAPIPQIDVPSEAATTAPDLPVPMATESSPVIAQVGELAKPWDSRPFTFRNRATGESVPALLIRLPGRTAAQTAGYWALAMKAVYSNCQLEYVQEIDKLQNDYGFRRASHPMIGNPCSRTVYDPLKYASISGNALARGAIVQGTDLRPPLGIEVKVRGKEIWAVRME